MWNEEYDLYDCMHDVYVLYDNVVAHIFRLQDEMGEARSVMRTLKEERDEIRGQLDAMQVRLRWLCFLLTKILA